MKRCWASCASRATRAALEDSETWRALAEEMRQQIEPTLLDLARYAAGRVQTTLGASAVDVSWDLANERAVNWAKQHAGDLVTKVTETTKRAVGEQVSQWSSSSEGLDGLIRRIEGMTDEAGAPIFNAARAETIAVTEATNTYAQRERGGLDGGRVPARGLQTRGARALPLLSAAV